MWSLEFTTVVVLFMALVISPIEVMPMRLQATIIAFGGAVNVGRRFASSPNVIICNG